MISPLDPDEARRVAARLRELDVRSVAVCFMHAHRHPEHEQRAGEILREELPGVPVSLSHEVIREQQEYERSAATAVNAYVRPLMERYVTSIQRGMTNLGIDGELTLMQSSGGVMGASLAAQRPVYVLESGPAAGVIAALALARRHEIDNAIAFDMGGTTAKAALIENGRVSWSREYEVGGGLSSSQRRPRSGLLRQRRDARDRHRRQRRARLHPARPAGGREPHGVGGACPADGRPRGCMSRPFEDVRRPRRLSGRSDDRRRIREDPLEPLETLPVPGARRAWAVPAARIFRPDVIGNQRPRRGGGPAARTRPATGGGCWEKM